MMPSVRDRGSRPSSFPGPTSWRRYPLRRGPRRGSPSSAASPSRHDARRRARGYSLNRFVMSDAQTRPSRVNLRKQMEEITRLRREMSGKTPDQRRTPPRAVARILDDVPLEGRMGRFVVESDEPLARGGTEKGPSPLQYVMMGTAF